LIIAAYPVIYIKADGSINPATANITSFDNVTYTFTADINASLVVLKNDIVVDGARHTLQGNGGETGIDLSLRHNVTLQDVDVTGFSYGISLSSSSNNTIIGNSASNNWYGIRLLDSSNSTIIGNTVSNNNDGIVVASSSNNTVAGNTVSSNSYKGIFLYSSSNSTIIGNTVSNNNDGIVVASSSNNTVAGNTISSNNMYGIYVSRSSNDTLAGNIVSSNGYDGIGLWDSSNNTIIGNTASNNLYGIRLDFSGNNVLTGNTAANNQHNFGVDGWLFSHFNNYVDTSNTVDGKPIYYLMGVADAVYDAETNAGAIYLINSNNITIEDLTLTRNHFGALFFNTTNSKIENITVANNYVGIYLLDSSNNVLASNTASSNNYVGIYLLDSSNNVLASNTASSNNMYGIQLSSSSNNVLFHNNLINNTNPTYTLASFNNTWDDGYPSGGNYWSNYTGLDADGDGIGDVPYTIGSNVDNYPLMGMFSDFVVTSEYHVQAICNSSISDFQYNGTAISFNVTGETDTAGFWRICIPRAMMNETYHVFVNGMEVPCNLLPCSDRTHSYLYFSYNHSTHEVIVIPEFPLLTILSLLMITTLLTALIYKKKSLPRANVSRGEALLHLGK
jgi:parallel beta-helix repeat protein